MNRVADGWSEAKSIPGDIGRFWPHGGISVAADGDLYFGDCAIYRAEPIDGEYVGMASADIDVAFTGGAPFVSADESFILFTRQRSDGTDSDIFASFRRPDGSWTEAIRFGASVSREGSYEMDPRVSTDGKYLFFRSNRKDGDFLVYWVDARVIEELRPD